MQQSESHRQKEPISEKPVSAMFVTLLHNTSVAPPKGHLSQEMGNVAEKEPSGQSWCNNFISLLKFCSKKINMKQGSCI